MAHTLASEPLRPFLEIWPTWRCRVWSEISVQPADGMFSRAFFQVTKVRTASSSITAVASSDATWSSDTALSSSSSSNNGSAVAFASSLSRRPHAQTPSSRPGCKGRWHEGLERYTAQHTIDQQRQTRLLLSLSLVQDVLPTTSGIHVPVLAAQVGLPSRTVHDPDLCKQSSSHLSSLAVTKLHPMTHQSCHGLQIQKTAVQTLEHTLRPIRGSQVVDRDICQRHIHKRRHFQCFQRKVSDLPQSQKRFCTFSPFPVRPGGVFSITIEPSGGTDTTATFQYDSP